MICAAGGIIIVIVIGVIGVIAIIAMVIVDVVRRRWAGTKICGG